MISSPQLFLERFLENRSGRLSPIKGSDISAMLILKPRIEISHAVIVVPTFAPIMIPMDSVRFNRPALTKLTTITVVAELLCMMAVISIPVITPLIRFEVIAERMWRIRVPATFCRASLMSFIPYRKTPKEPMSCRKSKRL